MFTNFTFCTGAKSYHFLPLFSRELFQTDFVFNSITSILPQETMRTPVLNFTLTSAVFTLNDQENPVCFL